MTFVTLVFGVFFGRSNYFYLRSLDPPAIHCKSSFVWAFRYCRGY